MLASVKVVVPALKSVKTGVRATFQDETAFHHQDLIRPADGRQAMGNHKGSAPLHQVTETVLNHRF